MELLNNAYKDINGIDNIIWSSEFSKNIDKIWIYLKELMDAHSPSGSVFLPGTIVDNLTAAVNQLGLKENYHENFKGTGNAAIFIGKQKEQIDLLIDAHIDEPTFGINKIETKNAVLFACCANRFPIGKYKIPAKVLRYDINKQSVVICGKGLILSICSEKGHKELYFELLEGEVDFTDLITIDVPAEKKGDKIIGSAIDDAGGSTIVLATASILKGIESLLVERSLNCLFTFSDNEEWPPESFFASGASKTSFAVSPPTFGSIIVDLHQIDYRTSIEMGKGISCGLISGAGLGASLPLNYQSLTSALIKELNSKEKNIAQLNFGYFSRSDEHALTRWSKILGLIGIPAINIHRGNEEADIRDIRGGIIYLAHYIPIVLGLSQTLSLQYQLFAIKS